MVKMSVINDALKNIVNAEKAGKRQVCYEILQPQSLPVEEVLWPLDYWSEVDRILTVQPNSPDAF